MCYGEVCLEYTPVEQKQHKKHENYQMETTLVVFLILAPKLVHFFICFALIYIEPICNSSTGYIIFLNGHADNKRLYYCAHLYPPHSVFSFAIMIIFQG